MKPVDYIIVIGYLALSLGLGIALRGRQESTRDYFTGSGQMRGRFGNVLVGLSLAATLFSGISLLSFPSMVFQHGPWVMLTLISIPASWAVLKFWFLPRYFAHGGATPYQIIGDRIGPRARLLASGMFTLLRLSWMSTLLYAPTLILIAGAGISESWFWPMVVLVGAICTFYTVVGGIRSVVVTDAMQFLVIVIGLAVVVGTQVSGMTWSQMRGALSAGSGLWPVPLQLGLDFHSVYNCWGLMLGITVSNLSSYMGDQMSLQRYLGSGNVRDACRSFAHNVFGMIVVSILLAAVGVLLKVWYAIHPDPGLPAAGDRVLPYFIARELPPGITGFLLAAILAATMSSMTSGINALGGCVTNDFIAPRFASLDERRLLRAGRLSSVVIGVCSTAGVALVVRLGSLWQIAMALLGIFLGPLLGLIVISCLKVPRPGERAVIVGVAAGCLSGVAISASGLASLWTPPVAFAGTVATAYLLAFAGSRSRLERGAT